MTVEQSKSLVQDTECLIYEGEICLFYRPLHTEDTIEILTPAKVSKTVSVFECQTLGEYRGSFDSSVWPPKCEVKNPIHSVEVIYQDKWGGLNIAWYDYSTKKWQSFFGDILFEFTYIFKPDYL